MIMNRIIPQITEEIIFGAGYQEDPLPSARKLVADVNLAMMELSDPILREGLRETKSIVQQQVDQLRKHIEAAAKQYGCHPHEVVVISHPWEEGEMSVIQKFTLEPPAHLKALGKRIEDAIELGLEDEEYMDFVFGPMKEEDDGD